MVSPFSVCPTDRRHLRFTPDMLAYLKAGHFTAGLAMHTLDAGWPKLQVEGIIKMLEDFGIGVVTVTDAKFQLSQQIAHLE